MRREYERREEVIISGTLENFICLEQIRYVISHVLILITLQVNYQMIRLQSMTNCKKFLVGQLEGVPMHPLEYLMPPNFLNAKYCQLTYFRCSHCQILSHGVFTAAILNYAQ